jgi:acetyl-CoA C-acetyltransferase
VNGIELIQEAVVRALEDADLTLNEIDAIVIGNMDHFEGINYVDTWSVEGSGAFMKPIFKITTGGTTGTSVAIAAYYQVASGIFNTVMAIGWEKNSESDTTGAIITCSDPVWDRFSYSGAIPSLAVEASAYMNRYGITERDAARVTVRDRGNAVNNPYAHLREAVTIDEVMASPMLTEPIKLMDICPRSDGAACVIFSSEDLAEKAPKAAWIHAVSVRHDTTWFGDIDYTRLRSLEDAAQEAFKKAGITEPLQQVDICELYMPYSFAGLKWMESIGFCAPGEAPQLVWDGHTDMDGMMPVNPSGGVLATNCIGATGLLRVGEAAIQLFGEAGNRQVEGAEFAMATGFGGCFWSDVLILGAKKP